MNRYAKLSLCLLALALAMPAGMASAATDGFRTDHTLPSGRANAWDDMGCWGDGTPASAANAYIYGIVGAGKTAHFQGDAVDFTDNAYRTTSGIGLGYYGNTTALRGHGTLSVESGTLTVTGGLAMGRTKDGQGEHSGTLYIQGGTLLLGADVGISSTTKVNDIHITSGALDMGGGGTNHSIPASSLLTTELAGGTVQNVLNVAFTTMSSGTVSNMTGTVTANLGTSASVFTGTIAGTGGLTKNHTGSLELTNTSGYNGATNINAGSLIVTGALNSAGTVAVNNTATLAGTGSVGAVTVNPGAFLAPGTASVGTLSVASLSLDNTGAMATSTFRLNSPSSLDKVVATGAMTYGGILNVSDLTSGSLTAGTYDLFDFGSQSGTFTTINLPTAPGGLSWHDYGGGVLFDYATGQIKLDSAGGPLSAGSGTWKNGAGNQNWTANTADGSNWTTGYPSAAGHVATFDSAVTTYAGGVVNVDSPVTVGGLVLDRNPGYTIGTSGGNAVTLDNGGSDATVTVSSGNHEIASPVTLSSNLAVSVTNSADKLTISGTMTGSGKSLAKSGAGELAITAAQAYTGGVSANAGTLTLGHEDAIPVPASTTGQNLYVGDGAQVVLGTGLPKAVQVAGLTMYGGDTPTGTVDLKNGQLVVDSTVSSLATVAAQVAKGYNLDDPDNPWKGPGITSSTAAAEAAKYAVGYALNGDFGELAWGTWFGREVNNDSVLVRFTYGGDTDLNGEVTTDDFDNWKQGYITHTSGWLHGDLDYSGDVTTDDFDLWKQVYVKHYAPLADGSGGGKVATSAVPEPGTLALLALAGLGLLAWRRRK